jgi:hypothetical protein
MKALFTFALCTLSVLTSLAQKSPIKFDEMPIEDLKMKVYQENFYSEIVIKKKL